MKLFVVSAFSVLLKICFSMNIPVAEYYMNGMRDQPYPEEYFEENSYADDEAYSERKFEVYPEYVYDRVNSYDLEQHVVPPDNMHAGYDVGLRTETSSIFEKVPKEFNPHRTLANVWNEDKPSDSFSNKQSMYDLKLEASHLSVSPVSIEVKTDTDEFRQNDSDTSNDSNQENLFTLNETATDDSSDKILDESDFLNETFESVSVPDMDPRVNNFSKASLNEVSVFETEGSGFSALNDSDMINDIEVEDIDVKTKREEFLSTVDRKFRSMVFNPVAQSHEKFQACRTPMNESGNCRYVQHCLLPDVIGAIDKFMDNICIIEGRFIGICCPEYPSTTIKVIWENTAEILETTNASSVTECGMSSKKRIVGGSKADPKSWPWMAALLTMSKGQFYCGGALINNLYVLTAAHCTYRIPKNQILVRLGEYDFGVEDRDHPGEDYPVLEIKRHGQYSRRTLQNDIAILKLGRPAKFNKNVVPICLPKKPSFVGETATLAGWGNVKGGGPSSKVLQEALLSVVDNTECAKEHGLRVPDISICTKSEEKNKGACNGDSGGPLMLLDEKTKQWSAIGIVSWGRRGCDPKFPTVYTRVSEYLNWIQIHAV